MAGVHKQFSEVSSQRTMAATPAARQNVTGTSFQSDLFNDTSGFSIHQRNLDPQYQQGAGANATLLIPLQAKNETINAQPRVPNTTIASEDPVAKLKRQVSSLQKQLHSATQQLATKQNRLTIAAAAKDRVDDKIFDIVRRFDREREETDMLRVKCQSLESRVSNFEDEKLAADSHAFELQEQLETLRARLSKAEMVSLESQLESNRLMERLVLTDRNITMLQHEKNTLLGELGDLRDPRKQHIGETAMTRSLDPSTMAPVPAMCSHANFKDVQIKTEGAFSPGGFTRPSPAGGVSGSIPSTDDTFRQAAPADTYKRPAAISTPVLPPPPHLDSWLLQRSTTDFDVFNSQPALPLTTAVPYLAASEHATGLPKPQTEGSAGPEQSVDLFLKDFVPSTTAEQLWELLNVYHVISVRILKITEQHFLGRAVVTVESSADAQAAIHHLNGNLIHNHKITVELAKRHCYPW